MRTKTKVLMLGPGDPVITNSGLGKAAHHISQILSKRIELTIVQPENQNKISEAAEEDIIDERFVTSEFSDFKVISEMVKIGVSNTVSPYWYDTNTTEQPDKKESTTSIQKDLQKFSKELFVAGKRLSFDVIYAHDWLTFQAAIKLKESSGKPLVLHVHSLDYDRNIRKVNSWVFELEKEAFLKADRIICVSNYSKGIIREVYGIEDTKIDVVYNGYTKQTIPKSKSPFKEQTILFVGRLTGQKGPTKFLEIAEKVNESYPNSRFIMAGEGDMYKGLIEAGAHSSVASKFHMTGHLEGKDLLKLYAMSDVYCMPSVSEPFGLTALEAVGADLPLVISTNSGAAEVLDGAISVDFDDTSAFAKAIVKLLKDEKFKQECITKNKESLASLTWEKSADEILTIINKV